MESLLLRLAALRSRARTFVMARGAGILLAALFGWALASLVLDFGLHLDYGMRVGFLLLAVAGAAFVAARFLVLPMRKPVSDDFLALKVEGQNPELRDLLISAVQLTRPVPGRVDYISPALIAKVAEEAGSRAASLRFEGALHGKRVLNSIAAGAAGLLLFGALWAADRELVGVWLERNVWLNARREWPKRTTLKLEDFPEKGIKIPRGSDLTLTVRAKGSIPNKVALKYAFKNGATGQDWFLSGKDEKARFNYAMNGVLEDVTFRILGGDDEIGPYEVKVLEPAKVLKAVFTVHHPAYTGLPPEEIVGEGSIAVPEGGRLDLLIAASKPLERASVNLGGKSVGALKARPEPAGPKGGPEAAPAPAAEVAGSLDAFGEGGECSVTLVDNEGLETKEALKFFLRVEKDQPPQVKAQKSGISDRITDKASIPLELLLRDRYGMTGGWIRWVQNDKPPVPIDLEGFPKGAREWTSKAYRLEVPSLNPKLLAGDAFSFEVVAEDGCTLPPSPAPGAKGAPGPGPGGTSATAAEIGRGKRTFATQAGLAFEPGARVRIASGGDPEKWMEGTALSYGGTELTVEVSRTSGSGTASDWTLRPAGLREGKSEKITLKVVTEAELQSELKRRQQMIRREFERIIDEQKRLYIDAVTLKEKIAVEGPLPEKAYRSLSTLERGERAVGKRVDLVVTQFGGILEEMRNNRIGKDEYDRLEKNLIGPLRALSNWKENDPKGRISPVSLQAVSESLYLTGRTEVKKDREALAERIPKEMEKIDAEMKTILLDMLREETLAEVIAILNEVLKLQQDVKKFTQDDLREKIRGLLPE